MSEQTGTIQVTSNYNLFKVLESNRRVDPNHVKRLGASMRENTHLFSTRPILVNENMFVIDGQHRLAAAKENKLPVYYMVSAGITVEDTRTLNTTQTNWTMLDFAKSYAATGSEPYKLFLRAVSKFPNLPMSAIRYYLGEGTAESLYSSMAFKSGMYQVPDYEMAEAYLEQLSVIRDLVGTNVTRASATAVLRLLQQPDMFDYDYFINKLEAGGRDTLSLRTPDVKTALRGIEDVYNFGRQDKNRVRFY